MLPRPLHGRLPGSCCSCRKLQPLVQRPARRFGVRCGVRAWAQLLASLFVTMSFSAGLPVLYWCFFFNCTARESPRGGPCRETYRETYRKTYRATTPGLRAGCRTRRVPTRAFPLLPPQPPIQSPPTNHPTQMSWIFDKYLLLEVCRKVRGSPNTIPTRPGASPLPLGRQYTLLPEECSAARAA